MGLKGFKGTGLSVSKSPLVLERRGFSSALQGKYRSFSNLSRSVSSFASTISSSAMRLTKSLKLIFRKFQGQRWFCITNNLTRQYPIQENSLSIALQMIWPRIQTIKDLYLSPSRVREKGGVGRLIPRLDKNDFIYVSRKFQRMIEAKGMNESNSRESNQWIFHRVLPSRFPNPLSRNRGAPVVEHAHIPKPLTVSESPVISTRSLFKGVLSYAGILSAIPLSKIFNPIPAKEINRRQMLRSVENTPLSKIFNPIPAREINRRQMLRSVENTPLSKIFNPIPAREINRRQMLRSVENHLYPLRNLGRKASIEGIQGRRIRCLRR